MRVNEQNRQIYPERIDTMGGGETSFAYDSDWFDTHIANDLFAIKISVDLPEPHRIIS